MGKPYPSVWKLFGKACAEFKLIDGTDTVLVPFDLTGPSCGLLFWLNFKSRRILVHFKIIPVYFFHGEKPNETILNELNHFCQNLSLNLEVRSVIQPRNQSELYSIYVDAAKELQCNKIALTDSLNYLNQTLLLNMCCNASFDCPALLQNIPSTNIFIIRPFGLLTDAQISTVSKGNNYPENPTAISIPPDPSLKICKAAIDHLLVPSTNISMNLFHSQFTVQRHYIGVGDGSTCCPQEEEDF